MAQYKILSLNYITAGKKHAFVNLDASLVNQQPTKITLLKDETQVSAITVDQGNIEYIDTDYIQKENEDPLSLEEGLTQTIVLKEDQKGINNIEAQDKAAILLKTKDDVQKKIDELVQFQQQMSAITNLTFEIETDHNASENNLIKDDAFQLLPMYDVKDLSIKSANKKIMQNSLFGTNQYVDVYAPSLSADPLQTCEANGYAYMLVDRTRQTPQSLNAYVNDNDDNSYYMQILPRNMKTYAYQSLASMNAEALADGKITQPATSYEQFFEMAEYDQKNAMKKMFNPKMNYKNLQYNYIFDFDQNSTSLNYTDGDIYAANINVGKNIYNSIYTIDMDDEDTINDTREYFSIGSMNNTVFLTYIDDIKQTAVKHKKNDEADVVDVSMKESMKTKLYYVEVSNSKNKK